MMGVLPQGQVERKAARVCAPYPLRPVQASSRADWAAQTARAVNPGRPLGVVTGRSSWRTPVMSLGWQGMEGRGLSLALNQVDPPLPSPLWLLQQRGGLK